MYNYNDTSASTSDSCALISKTKFEIELPFIIILILCFVIILFVSISVLLFRKRFYEECTATAIHIHIMTALVGYLESNALIIYVVYGFRCSNQYQEHNDLLWLFLFFRAVGAALYYDIFIYHMLSWLGVITLHSSLRITPRVMTVVKAVSCSTITVIVVITQAIAAAATSDHTAVLATETILYVAVATMAIATTIGYIISAWKLVGIVEKSAHHDDKERRTANIRQTMLILMLCLNLIVPLAVILLMYTFEEEKTDTMPLSLAFLHFPQVVACTTVMCNFGPLKERKLRNQHLAKVTSSVN